MNSKTFIVRMLVASAGVFICTSVLIKEWKLIIPAIILLVTALIYAIANTARDTSEERLAEQLNKDEAVKGMRTRTRNKTS